MSLTLQTFLQLLSTCAPLVAQNPTLRGLAVAQAQVESGFNPDAISPPGKDGLPDYGLMQIHPTNFARLGLTDATALDACRNLTAYQEFLTQQSRYNTGSPTAGFYNGYVVKVEQARLGLKIPSAATPAAPPASTCTKPDANEPVWHANWLACHPANPAWHLSYSLTGNTTP